MRPRAAASTTTWSPPATRWRRSDRIFDDYDKEEIRGAEPRYWEDVKEGQELPHVVKGPLRVTDNIAWKIGWGFMPFVYAHKVAVDLYKKHPHAFILNESGIPDVPERVHWDTEFARRVGCSGGLRLRSSADVLAVSGGHQLDRRRRLHSRVLGRSTPSQPQRRHHLAEGTVSGKRRDGRSALVTWSSGDTTSAESEPSGEAPPWCCPPGSEEPAKLGPAHRGWRLPNQMEEDQVLG